MSPSCWILEVHFNQKGYGEYPQHSSTTNGQWETLFNCFLIISETKVTESTCWINFVYHIFYLGSSKSSVRIGTRCGNFNRYGRDKDIPTAVFRWKHWRQKEHHLYCDHWRSGANDFLFQNSQYWVLLLFSPYFKLAFINFYKMQSQLTST